MTISHEVFKVLVVCPDHGAENVLLKIKRWFHENKLSHSWQINSKVEKFYDLVPAIEAARNNHELCILIPIGYEPKEVKMELAPNERKDMEVIIRPTRQTGQMDFEECPNSSFLSDTCTTSVQNILPAIHKSILRKHFSKSIKVRRLTSEDDFKQYFKLRYRIWNEMGYIPAHKLCTISQYELDYTDRTALPLGVFNQKQQLIACSRLVFPAGKESYHLPLIKKINESAEDKQLNKNFEYPKALKHPFDLLESFSGFNDYFAKLIKQGIRNAEVSRVMVAPEYRKSGLGEVLVDSLISMAQEEQLQLLFLACKKSHRGFYSQCGFKVVEGIASDHFADIEQSSIAMYKEL